MPINHTASWNVSRRVSHHMGVGPFEGCWRSISLILPASTLTLVPGAHGSSGVALTSIKAGWGWTEAGVTESNSGNVIGRIAGTEDSTPLKFHVAIDPKSYLQLDDVVVDGARGAGRAAR